MVCTVRENSSSCSCLPCVVYASVKAMSLSIKGTHLIRSAVIRLTLLRPIGLVLCMPKCFGQGCLQASSDSVTDAQACHVL